jgi:hypothetical protein
MVLPLDVALGVGVAVGDVPLLYQHSLEYPNAGSLLATPPTEQLTPLVKGPLTLYIEHNRCSASERTGVVLIGAVGVGRAVDGNGAAT